MTERMWKHWTEPRGILITQIPMEWQYRNPIVEPRIEGPPYSFEPYENALGCFQLSCYPLEELAPDAKPQENVLKWTQSRMDSEQFDTYVYYGSMGDQALIGKYIYGRKLRDDLRIQVQLDLVQKVLEKIIIIPEYDRLRAANLDKYDRFLGALAASYDLLNSAIESESYVQIVVVVTNQIDAFLRLAIVIAKQLRDQTDLIEVKYFSQGDKEKGISERSIFSEATELGVIDVKIKERLNELYDSRNRIIHRYIISSIKTRDIIKIVDGLLEVQEQLRLLLRGLEDCQIGKSFGIYGHGFERVENLDVVEMKRVQSWANDKHVIERFRRKISRTEEYET
ncbi:hypothetical protein [Geomonas oryzae]|uniref:hypothetical protein n=1 Tax=Geomonas oryzae TaxID=2364273 RepID=UPI001FE8CDDB|nr:hypothetical protein [Geomonas oryzae]